MLVIAMIALLISSILVTKACPIFRRHFQEQDFNPYSTALNCGLATSVSYYFLASLYSTYWTLIIGYPNSFYRACSFLTRKSLQRIVFSSEFRSVCESLFNLTVLFLLSYSRVLSSILSWLASGYCPHLAISWDNFCIFSGSMWKISLIHQGWSSDNLKCGWRNFTTMRPFLHHTTWDVFATLLIVTIEEERGFGYSCITACLMLHLSTWMNCYGIVILRVM